MTVMVGLALAVALFQPTPTTTVVIGDIGSRAFVFRSLSLDQRRDDPAAPVIASADAPPQNLATKEDQE